MSSSTASNILQDNRMQMQKDINFDATDHDANTWVNNHGTHCSPSTICVP
jgi:hypothetical protein